MGRYLGGRQMGTVPLRLCDPTLQRTRIDAALAAMSCTHFDSIKYSKYNRYRHILLCFQSLVAKQ